MINRAILGLCAALAGCMAKPPPPGPVAYTVGQPYQAGGEWRYPREFTSYDVTGLAVVIKEHHGAYTADNEPYDPDGLAAASPVLPLPSIVTVTNLVNGYSLRVRVNERGPDLPGRVLAVTPRVARLLGFPPGGVVEVEVRLDTAASSALQSTLGAGPRLAAAPVAGVTAQTLPPPGQGGAASPAQQLLPAGAAATGMASARLDGQVTVLPPAPGPLWVQVAGFGQEADAARLMARLYGLPARVVPLSGGDRLLWAVNIGPYRSVAAADQALRRVLDMGIAGPEIVVR